MTDLDYFSVILEDDIFLKLKPPTIVWLFGKVWSREFQISLKCWYLTNIHVVMVVWVFSHKISLYFEYNLFDKGGRISKRIIANQNMKYSIGMRFHRPFRILYCLCGWEIYWWSYNNLFGEVIWNEKCEFVRKHMGFPVTVRRHLKSLFVSIE